VDEGRPLSVFTDPPRWFMTWSLTPLADLSDLVLEPVSAPEVPPPNFFTYVTTSARPAPWPAWVSASGSGDRLGALVVTAPYDVAARFRVGAVFSVVNSGTAAPPASRPTARLRAPAPDPDWLAHRLNDRVRRNFWTVPPNPAAFQPWDARIDRIDVSHDGTRLRLSGTMDRGDTVAAILVNESATKVDLRVRVGVDPDQHPPPPPSIRIEPGRNRARFTGVSRKWRVEARLSTPLNGRAIYDLGIYDINNRLTAIEAWREQARPIS
jgi:hypothetical protein